MSKKFLIILIASILGILLLSLIGYYFILQNGSGGTNGNGGFSFRSFLPFGGDSGAPQNNTSGGETATTTTHENPPPSNFTQKLRELSTEPVAGAGTFDIKAGTVVRYIEKATGHVFEVEMFSPNNGRISNTTIPLVYDALWGSGGANLIARYIDDTNANVQTYSLALKNVSTTTESTISGIQFPGGISDVSVYGTSVFYLQQSTDISQGYTSNFDGTKKKLIFSSDQKEFNSQFVNDKTVALTTKPYQTFPGFLYFVDTTNGAVRRVLGDILGLSTLVNNTATQVLYLDQENDMTFNLFDIKTKKTTQISPKTFPEKCVWSKKDPTIAYCAVPREILDNTSLTSWYMGTISFTDDIWKFDLKNNTSSIIEDLSAAGEAVDVIKPILSDNEQYLVFVNKIDNTLWSLDLTK